MSNYLNKKIELNVDGVVFQTTVSSVSFAGYDLENFGENNEWADGKHYAGIIQCLAEMFQNKISECSIERRGSNYTVRYL